MAPDVQMYEEEDEDSGSEPPLQIDTAATSPDSRPLSPVSNNKFREESPLSSEVQTTGIHVKDFATMKAVTEPGKDQIAQSVTIPSVVNNLSDEPNFQNGDVKQIMSLKPLSKETIEKYKEEIVKLTQVTPVEEKPEDKKLLLAVKPTTDNIKSNSKLSQ